MVQRITDPPPLPPRPEDGHKGTFGTVIVVGGCATMPGAPAMAATSAFRSGAGLVKIATDAATLPLCLTMQPSCTGIVLGEDAGDACGALDEADASRRAVLAVGPGMGSQPGRQALVLRLLAGDRAVVLDADGLNLLAKAIKADGMERVINPTDKPRVLTPHPGEYRRLAEAVGITADPVAPDQRESAAQQLAQRLNMIVLLKGRRTLVSDGQRVYENATGNPALATAGSGDVLTGLIAGLLAQGMTPFDAACLSAHLHGAAADRWAADHGQAGMLATDLLARIPDALHAHRQR